MSCGGFCHEEPTQPKSLAVMVKQILTGLYLEALFETADAEEPVYVTLHPDGLIESGRAGPLDD